MAEVAGRIGPELITVCLGFDERVLRMGFGVLAAVLNGFSACSESQETSRNRTDQ
jgi:hypothetical protein